MGSELGRAAKMMTVMGILERELRVHRAGTIRLPIMIGEFQDGLIRDMIPITGYLLRKLRVHRCGVCCQMAKGTRMCGKLATKTVLLRSFLRIRVAGRKEFGQAQ